ncbi:MAG: crotonase/enoyl-CoA hydratase family protein [Alphaproteobacteria bacterium]
MDRPNARNAVDPAQAERLRAAFESFERNAEARVAVLAGANGTFCAGYDLKSFADRRNDEAKRLDYDPEGEGPMGPSRRLLSKPVIAAVEGHAVAGGLELALWCDLRVASETAVFGVFCRRWGVPLIDGGTVRLPRVVGMGRALDMILTGRPVEAREASRMGLANRLVPCRPGPRGGGGACQGDRALPRAVHAHRPAERLSPMGHGTAGSAQDGGPRGLALLLEGARDGVARFASGSRGGDFGDLSAPA